MTTHAVFRIRYRLLIPVMLIPVACFGCGGSGKSDFATRNDITSGPTAKTQTVEKRESEAAEPSAAKSDLTGPITKSMSAIPQEITRTPVITKVEPQAKPEPVYRPSDNRPKHDDGQLAKLGIHRYDSKRLRLYTDLDPKIAAGLPQLIDGAYDALTAYFGELPPTREKSAFQVTGYLIVDKALFDRAGLVPRDLPTFVNGRHRDYEFWMYDPPWPYYRRHLLIHEATHCFMYAVRDTRFPVWYMEGMAEYFGTHAIDKTGKAHYGVMPQRFDDYVGFGRIEFVQEAKRKGKLLSMKHVVELKATEFIANQPYAWSWAFCKFFDSHPRYQKPFRELGKIETSREFVRRFQQLVFDNSPGIFSEWILFATGLCYGYDTERSAVVIKPGTALPKSEPVSLDLKTDRGWQSSGVHLAKGEVIDIAATGRFQLADKPKPWISEPQGITFTYFLGRPLGEVVAVVVPDSQADLPVTARTLYVVPIGRAAKLTAAVTGTVYLRINDSFAKLADNSGTVKITIRRPESK